MNVRFLMLNAECHLNTGTGNPNWFLVKLKNTNEKKNYATNFKINLPW